MATTSPQNDPPTDKINATAADDSGRAAARAGGSTRALRLGLVLGGKIVEEKLLRKPREVSVGQSMKNEIAVPFEGVPESWTLFVTDGKRMAVRLSEKIDARIADGGAPQTLAELRQARRARPEGEAWLVPLSDRARGKIQLGAASLMFQFVDAPPPPPPPKLPDSVRGTFADRIDPVLAIVLAVSLLLHASVALYAYQRDRIVHTRTTRVYNETFQRPTVSVAEVEFERPQQPEPAEKAQPEKQEQPEQRSDKPTPQRERQPRERAPNSGEGGGTRDAEEALRLQEQAAAAVDALFGDDFSETGIGGGSSDRAPGRDLDEAINQVRESGGRVAWGTGEGRGTRGSTSATVGTSQGPGVEGPGETVTRTEEKRAERVPTGRIRVGDTSSIDDTTLRPSDVLRRIQQIYMNGLKRCHRELLKRDPSAGGTITLRFTVGESGRVTRVKADGFDPGVDRCVEQRAQAWRFGVPKDEDGDSTIADFKISLVLQPD